MVDSSQNRKSRRTRAEKPPVQNLGDVVDRLTILSRKIFFGEEAAISEHRYLEQSLSYWGIEGKVVTNVIRLAQMNIEIWNLENEMRRSGKKPEEMTDRELREAGLRAVKIRDLNRKRIEYKNLLTEISKRGFREVKVCHRSQ